MAVKRKTCKDSLKNITIIFVFRIIYISAHEKTSDMFYILKATNKNTQPFDQLTIDQEVFPYSACAYRNCYITDDASYFKDVRNFDAVLFNVVDLYKDAESLLPLNKRSSSQKYVFVSTESSTNHPIRHGDFDGFFNWTWTYRLDSDIPFQTIVVNDARGHVIGPNRDMHWMDTDKMIPTSKYTISILRKKNIAAAWFVSNCEVTNRRLEFAYKLKTALNNHGERLDIYGRCGHLDCPEDGREQSCYDMIEKDYFFYLAFENSLSADYVTEKLLIPLKYFAVPIVYGGANYTRFMPDGIYINARSFVPEQLASEMVKIMQNQDKYYDYFKWHRYFSYSQCKESQNICALCTKLNNEALRTTTSIYTNLSLWWNESQPINMFEPEVRGRAHTETGILNIYDKSTPAKEPTTQNSIKEFLTNVLQYYETI